MGTKFRRVISMLLVATLLAVVVIGVSVGPGVTISPTGRLSLNSSVVLAAGEEEMVEFTYYFNAYDTEECWYASPQRLADGNENTEAFTTVDGEVEKLTGNNSGVIGHLSWVCDKVELRVKAYQDDDVGNKIILRPVFAGGDGDNHELALPVGDLGWTGWVDITKDTNAPASWTLDHIVNLDCDVEAIWYDSYVNAAMVQLRVTIESVKCLRPNGVGSETSLASQEPDSGSHFDKVNEAEPDDDIRYVYQETANWQRDLYTLPDSEGSGAINSVVVCIRVRSSIYSGYSHAKSSLKSNGVVTDGTVRTLTEDWTDYFDEDILNPADDQPWEWADIDALEAGVSLEVPDEDEDARCTQVYVVVDYTPLSEADISNTPASKDFGVVASSTPYWSNGSAPTFPLDDSECYFTVTNNGDPCSITITATNFTGGVGWTLGTPAENVARLKAGKSGDSSEGDMVTLTTSPQSFISGLVTTKKWEIKMEMPTSFTDGVLKTSTVTLVATLD